MTDDRWIVAEVCDTQAKYGELGTPGWEFRCFVRRNDAARLETYGWTPEEPPEKAAIDDAMNGPEWTIKGYAYIQRAPPERAAEIHALAVLADRDPGGDATMSELLRLEAKYGRDDPDLVRCRALIDFMTS